jgi:hypothetical protein
MPSTAWVMWDTLVEEEERVAWSVTTSPTSYFSAVLSALVSQSLVIH